MSENGIIYQDGNIALKDGGDRLLLTVGEDTHIITDNTYFEPDIFIKTSDRKLITVSHSFTLKEIVHAIERNADIRMITGNQYDIKGVIKLLIKAIELGEKQVDISYLEGHCFMDYMRERGAVSPETAVSPAEVGMDNPNLMYVFLHSHKVEKTPEGLFYLLTDYKDIYPIAKAEAEANRDPDYYNRTISNSVRFGAGYRRPPAGGRQYFAWHGYPNRNDDLITYAEISESEFEAINREYSSNINADRDTAEIFRRKYIEGHPVIAEGWNMML